jgi:tRNA(fMet)-specific endonuclease VapC
MADYLLCDTCIIIDHMSGRSQALDELINNNATLFINSIIEMELLQGARNKVELRRIEKKLSQFRLLSMQQVIFDLATQLIRDYRLSNGLLIWNLCR